MKLQPNFSWQKYEGKSEDKKEQFQYQLMQQHVVVANSVNATIDDESFFLRERQTAFAWVNNKPIWTKTIPTSSWTVGGTINTIPLGIILKAGQTFTIIDIVCCISDGTNTLPLPYVDVTGFTNCIQMERVSNDIVLTSGGFNYSAYSGFVTVYFIKN